MRFISHRDVIRIVKQAVIRSHIPVAHSSGFNPRPRISFYNPLQVGVESDCEVLSVSLTRYCETADVRKRLNQEFPSGMYCVSAENIKSRREITIVSSQYRMPVSSDEQNLIESKLPSISDRDFSICKERNNKEITVADKVGCCYIEEEIFYFTLKNTSSGAISAKEFLAIFFPEEESVKKLYTVSRYGINRSH